MQTKTKWVGFSAVALAALLASCSGDDGDSENGSGGSSSSTSGSGGSGAGKGGSTGTAGSGKAGSGSGGTGGSNPGTAGFNFGGNLNLGGAGFDPDDYACEPAPTPGSDCEANAQPCLNGTDVCYCANAEWACMDILGGGGGAGPGGELECPANKPASGSACDAQGICPYGGQNEGCVCYGGMWTCSP